MCPLSAETDSTHATYLDRVDQLVRSRAQTDSTPSWDELLRSLPGIDPFTVIESIRRQGLTDKIDLEQGRGLEHEAPTAGLCFDSYHAGALPTPHPLDYSWWFDAETIDNLASLLQLLSSPDAHVVLLGIPTLFDAVTTRQDSRAFSLIDSDPLVVNRRTNGTSPNRAFLADLTTQAVDISSARVVVADPPWYESEVLGFLWVARKICEQDGLVLMSVPPEGTRPGIDAEWRKTVRWAKTLGLEVEDYRLGLLSYVSPLFERNAMIAGGVPLPVGSWRRGDLVIFRCAGACRRERPTVPSRVVWQEHVFGNVRIRVRRNGGPVGWNAPTLKRIVPSDVLPSVSRRDPRRDLADVWTSGNRVFACGGTAVLRRILDSIAEEEMAVSKVEYSVGRSLTAVERDQVEQVEGELRRIIEMERAELTAWREQHARVDVVTG